MAKIYGQLEQAQAENVSADPSGGKAGRLVWNYTDAKFRIDNGTTYKEITVNDQTQTLTNKTVVVANNTITTASSGNLAATELNAALAELQTDIDTRALATGLSDHLADATDAHDASAISFVAGGTVAATDVQTAIAEVATDAASALSTHESDTSTHGVGVIVGTTETQTLTNKLIGLDDGSSGSALALYFDADDNTGIYRSAADTMEVVAGSYTGLQVKKSTGNYANVGMGTVASSSDDYPLIVSRSIASSGTVIQVNNPNSAANSAAQFNVSSDGNTITGDISAYSAASTVDSFASAVTVKATGSSAKLSLTAPMVAVYTNGYFAADEALRINADKSVQFMQQISTPATPASGTTKLYGKSDDRLYQLDDSGTEKKILAGTASIAEGGTNNTSLGVTAGGVVYTDGSKLMNVGAGSSGQILRSNGSSAPTWAAAPSGGINYISANSDAESDASSWTTYDDGAATPVDLTGGTFGGTFARTTTTPLRGTGSLLYTPGSIGEGVAFTITPDLADYGNVLEFGFDYDYVSATAATGDYTVWVYDVNSSTLIQPVGYQVPGAVTGVYGKFKCTFQVPSTATTLRIGIHQTTATSAALEFDNVYCGPQLKSYGPFASDWVSFTPTISGLGTGSATLTGKYRRVGDSAEFRIYTAITSAGTGSGLVTYSFSGIGTLDATKIPAAAILGSAWSNGVEASSQVGSTQAVYYSSTTFYLGDIGSSANGYLGSDYRLNAEILISGTLPISGWSSGQLLSSDAGDSRVVAARYKLTGAMTSSSTTPINFDTKDFDSHSAVTTSPTAWKFTAPIQGVYEITASAYNNGGSGTTLDLYKNGSSYATLVFNIATTTSGQGSSSISLNAGDYVDVRFGTSLATGTNPALHYIDIRKVSGGNQQLAASESVNARATNTAGSTVNTTITSGTPFATETYDSHGAYSSPTFTCPIAGKFAVSAHIEVTSTAYTTTQVVSVFLYKNGSNYSRLGGTTGNGASFGYSASGYDEVSCVAGDTLDIRVYSDVSTTLSTTAGRNHISFNRIGN
jgi:hypothetical protein